MKKIFGPVPSRRLGRSIGINNIPPKICSYSCVYCQLGRAIEMSVTRREYYKPQDLIDEVGQRLRELSERGEKPDYLTFVPDGEPTLDLRLGESIAGLKQFGIPVALITNSSLMAEPALREELCGLDWISLKVDAVSPEVWKKIDRPHKDIDFPRMLHGVLTFSETFQGKLTTETMLVEDHNAVEDEIDKIAAFLEEVEPNIAYISIPTRPPAEKWVRPAGEEILGYAYHRFAEGLSRVEHLIGYEGNDFSSSGNSYEDILSITAVHPMRHDAVEELLAKGREDWKVVDRLLGDGKIICNEYNGQKYYLRKFREKQMGTR
jgi:wyosine [tRNA(Phe)-imidazoG37] synthetase (radical SAM superfamily)